VVKTLGETVPSRRGRRRIFYSVSPGGLEALQNARDMNDKLWTGISRFAFDREKI